MFYLIDLSNRCIGISAVGSVLGNLLRLRINFCG